MPILTKPISPSAPRAWRLYRARPSGLIMALLAIFGASAGFSFAQNVIVPKGTTATRLQVNGAVTDITTGTIRGNAALNAFSRFEVDRNNTVNLIVPSNAQFLLNMVTDAPVTVNGVVNSLKDGRIGGNVVFADPFGMIVGSSGALNVGSLLVTTPSRGFIDGVIKSDGSIDSLSVSALLDGSAPGSGMGTIRIDGQVNARDFIRLQGAAVNVNGVLRAGAGAELAHQAAFLGAVNAGALEGGAALVEHGGVIEIVAGGDVALAGTVSADGRNAAAGTIDVRAGHDLTVAPGASVSARGQGAQSDGGRVLLVAAHDAVLGAGASLDASAGDSGDGGFIEFSAANLVTIDRGAMRAGAAGGQAGKVLIDPATIDWTSAQDQFNVDGTSFELEADASIVLNDVVVSTRNVGTGTVATRANIESLASIGASGNITLKAPSITLSGGTRLLAFDQGVSAGAGGIVRLEANTVKAQPALGTAEATSTIHISNAAIKANDVQLVAKTTVDSRYIYDGDKPVETAAGLAMAGAQTLLKGAAELGGVSLVYSDVIAKSTITVGAGSVIEARRTAALTAQNDTKAGIAHKAGPNGVPGVSAFGIGASYVSNASEAKVVIESGASIKATDLTIRAHNDASVVAQTKSPQIYDAGQDAVSVAFSATNADVNATARVDNGATLQVSGTLAVSASNVGNFVNETETETGNEGKAAASVAWATHASSAQAELNANVADAASVAVLAVNDVQKDFVTASSSVGASAAGALSNQLAAQSIARLEKPLYNFLGLGSLKPKDDLAPEGSNAFRIGGAIAIANNKHTANASIGAGSAVHASDSALVAARVLATDFKIGAVSAAVSQSSDQTKVGTARSGYSAGLAVANITREASAVVGDNAVVTAPKIAVSADTIVPIRTTPRFDVSGAPAALTRWTGLDAINAALDSIGISGDTYNGISSAKANGDGSEDSQGIYGSVSLLTMNDHARAEIGSGAKLLLSGHAAVTAAAPWSTTLQLRAAKDNDRLLGLTGAAPAITQAFSFDAPATLSANYDATYLFMAGQAPTSGSAKGLGASIGQTILNNRTQAIVREGAVIEGVDETAGAGDKGSRTWSVDTHRAADRVVVEANSNQRVISRAATGGVGATFGLNGTLSLTEIDSKVQALIDDEAIVRASTLGLQASNTPVLWSIAGSLNHASSASVGVGIAINKVQTESSAEIADNDTVASGTTPRASALTKFGTDPTLQVRDLLVDARSGGAVKAISVAGSLVWNSPDKRPGLISKLSGYYSKAISTASGVIDTVTLKGSPDAPATPPAAQKTKKEPTFSFAGAGSASANQVEMRTSALIKGVVLDQGSSSSPHALTVRAIGDADIVAGSGSAALAIGRADESKSSSAIAGSVAVNQLGNGTSARITDSTVTHAGDVSVQALTGGEQLAVAIAAAVTAGGSGTESADQLVGSVSVTQTLDDDEDKTKNYAHAGVGDSSITADATAVAGGARPTVDVTAYNRSFIGTGGGSLSLTVAKSAESGTAAGVAFSFAKVDNDVAASIDHATLKQFQKVGVNALNATEIAAGAAFVGASNAPEANSFAGSTVVSIISNTTKANIGGVSTVEALGNVTVRAADSGANEALEDLIDPDGKRNSIAPGLDYCAAQVTGTAPSGSCITSVAGMVQAGAGSNYGLSLGYNQITNRTSASIGEATVKLSAPGSSIDVLAGASTSILSVAAGVGASKKMAGAGSGSLNFVDNTVSAAVGNAAAMSKTTVLEASTIRVKAEDDSSVRSLAGQISIGVNNAIGLALTLNDSHSVVAASVDNARLTAADAVTVDASNQTKIDSIAVSGAVSTEGNAGGGSLALNFIHNSLDATMRGSSTDAGSAAIGNAVSVKAADTSDIRSLSGAAAFSSKVGAGVALSFNSIDNASRALIDTSTLTGVDTLTLSGALASDIESAAIALGISTSEVGLGGSITINEIGISGNVASGELINSTVNASEKTDSRGSVEVTAADSSEISSLAGAAGGGSHAGFGAAVAENGIATTVTARVENAGVHGARTLVVGGTSTALIESVAAAGAGAGDVGGAGSASSNHIGNKTYAELVDAEVDGGKAVVEVKAEDKASIDSLAGAGAVGGTAAAGLSVALNMVGGAGQTQVAQARVSGRKGGTNGLTVDSLLVKAGSDSTIRTIGAAGAGGGTGGIGGSVVTNIVAKDVAAFIDGGAQVSAVNNIGVLAASNDKTSVASGSLGAGGALGIGASSAFNQIDGSVRAYVDGAGTTLDADARDASNTISVNSGTLANPTDVGSISAPRSQAVDLSETQLLVRGLAVNASSHQSVNNLAVSAGASGGISGAVVPIINLMGGDTTAFIHAASINTRTGPAGGADVNVLASSHGFAGDFASGAAVGQGAASGAASANRTDRRTSAYITDAVVGNAATRTQTAPIETVATVTGLSGGVEGAEGISEAGPVVVKNTTITRRTLTSAPNVGAVKVQARASQATADIVTGLAAGLVAGTATGAVTIFGGTTEAYVERGQLTAASLAVDAKSSNAYNMLAVSGAGGLVGVGGAFGVGIADATTDAHVGEKTASSRSTALKLGGALTVSALTESKFDSTVISGSAGGFAGVAGTAVVTLVNNSTAAGVYNVATADQAPQAAAPVTVVDADGNAVVTTDLRAGGLLADALGAVTVNALETIVVKPVAGAVALGGFGAGGGAAANVVVVKSAVTGEIVNSAIDSANKVTVNASSDKRIDMIGLSGGAGATSGIGGALGVLVVGSGATGNANDELDKGNDGTLTKVNAFTKAPASGPGQQAGQRAAPGYDVKAAVNGLDADAVTARIVGGRVDGTAVTVSALAATSTGNLAGAAGASVLLGAGGAVGVSRVYSTVNAAIDGTEVHAAGVDVTALARDGGTGQASSVTSVAGGAGLVGLGAAVSDALIQNKVTARADGNFTGSAAGDMRVAASDNSSVATDGVGAAAGALAVGVVVSHADKRSSVDAAIGAGSSIAGFNLLAVSAGASAPLTGATVSAKSTGAAGGLLLAGAGAESVADNRTQVRASIGNDVTLPNGNVSVTATNLSRQLADATGIAGAGLVAASGAVARANSGSAGERMVTSASLGERVIGASGRAGYLQVSASGVDVNTAQATAAAGGVVAGNASQASTGDYADVRASVGSGAGIHAGSVTISADHVDSHYDHANSLNASLVGGSGANASHVADVNVAATVGADSTIDATGTVQVLADNMFDNNTGSGGESASGAGGGVLNGAAAGSSTSITAHTDVRLADRVAISSGPSASTSPYTLVLRAANHLSLSDTVVLKTGGLIAGAGVVSHTSADLNSNVTTGLGNRLTSLGSIGIGSYADAAVRNSALVETHGLAAVGSTDADTDITANQLVRIGGGNTLIRSFGNLDITAGKDPTGAFNTVLSGNASAQGYVRGLIAVPAAQASTTLASNASLDIASGASVESAQNAIVGAYQGASNAIANGTGRGFQLGFIPVTDSDSSTDTPSSANVTINGDVKAGIYHDLRITIDDCRNSGAFCSQWTQSASSAPTSIEFLPQFDAAQYVRENFADAATRELMLSGVAANRVGAVKIGALYAAGGTVTVNAANLQGAGALTSFGAPKIEVINNSADYLLVGSATIPNTPGGEVLFSGTAGRATAQANNMRITETGKGQAATVSIQNNYAGNVGGAAFGPALMLMGDVNNLGGKVEIVNKAGSVGQSAQILGQQVNIDAPNGVFVVELPDSRGPFYAGSNPYSEWQKAMIWPGGDPSLKAPTPDLAIAFVASAMHNAAAFNGDNVAFNRSFIHEAGASDGSNFSRIYYGSSFRYSDYQGTANALSPMRQSLPLFNQDYSYIPMVPIQELKREWNTYGAANLSGSAASSAILGSKVAIKAKYIDINGKITAGQPTDWSVSLSSSVASQLSMATALYRAGLGGAVHEIDPSLLGLLSPGDSPIRASFDAVTQQITLANVSASSGGGSVLLHGQILSTNPLGNIHVNGGFGKVSVNNQTGYALKIQDINAGNGALLAGTVGKVEIIDTSFNAASNHTLYTYTPEAGVRQYRGAAATPADQLALVASGAGSASSTYQPLANMRWQWTDTASLSRDMSLADGGWTVRATNWQFVGDRNQPWTRSSGGVVAGSASDPIFRQVVSASTPGIYRWSFGYGGCDDPSYQTSCNYGFKQTNENANPWRALWKYQYVDRANLTMTSSVKADNPIKIDFSGNASGTVSITSNAAVHLAGQLINPSGVTTVNAGGAITQGAKGGLSTHDLNLQAGQSIGTEQKAIGATLADGGVLNATSGAAGIHLELGSGATIGTVAAGNGQGGQGDVRITASDSLLARNTGTANIKGNNISLVSSQGSVGGAGAPMVISAIGNPGLNGALGGVVNVQAHDGINLRQVGADLLVGQIASTGSGDVSIAVSNGTIYDARGQTAANTLSDAQVQEVWDALKLTADRGAETGKRSDASVLAFEGQLTRDYKKYWDLRARGTVDANGQLELDAANIALLRPMASSTLPGTASDAQVLAFANAQYQSARTALGDAATGNALYGPGWESSADFTAYNDKFAFSASGAQIASLTERAVWNVNELSYSINRTALAPTPSQQVGSATANIIGRAVTIDTSDAVGKLAPAVHVSLAVRPEDLTTIQKAALGLAKAPGDIKATGVDAQGRTVVYDFGTAPAGVTMTGYQLAQTSPLFIDATGAVNIKARGGVVYLQGTGENRDLWIDRVAATSDVSLTAPRSIVAAPGAGGSLAPVQIVAGGDVRLTAGNGDLGSAVNPLSYQAGGILQLATAGQSMFLRTPSGDMRLGGLAAGNLVRLDASSGSILAANQNAGLTIRGKDVVLNAAIDLGSADNALRVSTGGLAASGKLDGVAGGSAWLYAPGEQDLMRIGSLEAGGAIGVGAAGDLAADRLGAGTGIQVEGANVSIGEASGSALAFAAGGTLDLGSAWSGHGMNTTSDGGTRVSGIIEAGGDVSVTAAAFDMDAGSGISAGGAASINALGGDAVLAWVSGAGVAVAAEGRILAVQPGANIYARGSAGTVFLNSTGLAGGIGARGAALGVDAADLSAASASGDLLLDLWSDTRASLIDATQGDVDVLARASLHAAHIGGNSVSLATAGDFSAQGIAAWNGAALITTGRATSIGSLWAAGAASVSGTGAIALGRAEAGATGMPAALDVVSNGDLSIVSAAASGDVRLSGNAVSANALAAGADASITAAGTLDVGMLDAMGDARLSGGADVTIGAARAGLALRLDSAGDTQFGSLDAGTQATLASRAGSLRGDRLAAGSLVASAAGATSVIRAEVVGTADITTGTALAIDTLVSGGNAILNAGGDAVLGTVSVGDTATPSSLAVVSGGALILDNANVSLDVSMRAASAQLGQIRAGRDIGAVSSGGLDADLLDAGRDLQLAVGGDATLARANAGNRFVLAARSASAGTLAAGGDASLATSGSLTVNRLASAGDASLVAGTDAVLGTVDVGDTANQSSLAITSGGVLTLDDARASQDVSLRAASAQLGEVRAGADIGAATSGGLDVVLLDAGRDLQLAAGGDAALATATAGRLFALDARSASAGTLTAGGDARLNTTDGKLAVNTLDTGTLAATANGDAALNEATVRGAASLKASASLAVGRFASAGNASFDAGDAAVLDQVEVGSTNQVAGLTVTSGGAQALGQLGASGDIALHGAVLDLDTARAGGDMRVAMRGDARIGQVDASGSTGIAAAGNLALGRLASLGDTTLAAGADAVLGRLTVGGAGQRANLVAEAGKILSAANIDGTGNIALQGAAAALGAVQAQGDLALQAGTGGASYNRLGAGGELTATVVSQLAGGSGSVLTSARDVRIKAGNFTFDQAGAGRSFTIDPVGDVGGNVLDAGTDLLIRSSGTINVASIRAAGEADLSANGSMVVGKLSAASLSASTPGLLAMDVLVGAGKLRVGAGTIEMKVRSGGPRLEFDMTGYQGGVADSAVLAIDAPAGTSFARFRARNAELTTNADSNSFASAYITGAMRFTNPSGQMYMNNVNPTSVAGPLLQLVQPTFGFTLAQEGLYYLTDAYVTQYMPQYRPISPNHQEDRAFSAIMAYGASAGRSAGSQDSQRGASQQDAQSVFQRAAAEARPQFDTGSDGAESVNWGEEVTALPAGEIQIAANSRAYPDQ